MFPAPKCTAFFISFFFRGQEVENLLHVLVLDHSFHVAHFAEHGRTVGKDVDVVFTDPGQTENEMDLLAMPIDRLGVDFDDDARVFDEFLIFIFPVRDRQGIAHENRQ
ncbi:MAG TPA: hypothetical protein DCP62_09860 [Erysipelotrichaceae bacterium]|nr:hypothetical protein [Erysipelotrichaceae bacterium]